MPQQQESGACSPSFSAEEGKMMEEEDDDEEDEDTVVSKTIGNMGRWQAEKTVLLSACAVPLAWHFMSYPLLAQEDDFLCILGGEDQEASEDQCAWRLKGAGNGTEGRFRWEMF